VIHQVSFIINSFSYHLFDKFSEKSQHNISPQLVDWLDTSMAAGSPVYMMYNSKDGEYPKDKQRKVVPIKWHKHGKSIEGNCYSSPDPKTLRRFNLDRITRYAAVLWDDENFVRNVTSMFAFYFVTKLIKMFSDAPTTTTSTLANAPWCHYQHHLYQCQEA
jgi:hypothetical protein